MIKGVIDKKIFNKFLFYSLYNNIINIFKLLIFYF